MRTMSFVFTVFKLFVVGFVVLFIVNFLVTSFTSLRFDLFDIAFDAIRKVSMLVLLTLGLIPLFIGVMQRNGIYIFISIIVLFLAWVYANKNLEVDLKNRKETAYFHNGSPNLTSMVAGLGLGYLLFSDSHEDDIQSHCDYQEDANHFDESYQDDVDADWDQSDDFDYDPPDD